MAARQKRLHVLVKDLSRDFRLQADAKVAAGYSAYMRNQFPFLGLRAPVRRQVQKGVFAKHGLEDGQELTTVLKQLWKMEEREYQMAAIDLAVKYKKLWTQEMFETFEYMVRNKSWWDTVDLVASKLVGGLIQKHPDLVARMNEWIDDEHMWARRTAIIHQLNYKAPHFTSLWWTKTDQVKLFDFCKRRAHEKEFFIRKAIGWALRQHARLEPDAVVAFIEENRTTLSALSVREATKQLAL